MDSYDDLTDINLTELDEHPSVQEFKNPTHDFKVKLEESRNGDAFVFSSRLNRIFTSTDKSLTFHMSMNPYTPLVIRIMMVCSNQIYQPLYRCSLHIRDDGTMFRDHVVTHKDAEARYVGTAHGVHFRDRLAILVPIEQMGQKSISLEFKCLSSCYKIRKITTALVFTLEDEETSKILGREVFNFHVSKNFKRDAEVAEKVEEKLTKRSQDQLSTLVDLTDLRFLLPLDVTRELLDNLQCFFKAKLYNTNDETSACLTKCLNKVNVMMENIDFNAVKVKKCNFEKTSSQDHSYMK